MPDNRKPLIYGAFPVCRNYTVRAQLRQPSSGKRRSHEADSGMAGSQRLLHHRQYLRPPRLRFQTLVCTGDAGGAGLWQCVSMMPYAPKTGWTGDVPAKKNGQTNKIHLSIRFGGAFSTALEPENLIPLGESQRTAPR